MNGHVDSWHLELLKKDLHHLLLVLSWIHVGFSQQDGALVGRYLEQGEGMLPQLFHVIPVVDDPVRQRVLQLVEPSLTGVQLFSDVCFLLVGRVGNDDIVLGPANYGWEDVWQFFLSTKADLHESTSVIDDNRWF